MSTTKKHTIVDGECISTVALRTGVGADMIWSHPDNAALAELRADPNVLATRDVLAVPALSPATFEVPTGGSHVFALQHTHVELRLCLQRDAKPIADEPFEIRWGASAIAGTTDGDGMLEVSLPADIARVRLTLVNRRQAYTLEVGALDPADTDLGAAQRLGNLGYFGASDLVTDALARFQRAVGLAVTGTLDDDTAVALRDEHGG